MLFRSFVRELNKDFGVDTLISCERRHGFEKSVELENSHHCHTVNSFLFPIRERWCEDNIFVLKYAKADRKISMRHFMSKNRRDSTHLKVQME